MPEFKIVLLLIVMCGIAGFGLVSQELPKPVAANASNSGEQKPNGEEARNGQATKLDSSAKVDVSYISEEFIGAVVVHPQRFLNSQLIKKVKANIKADAPLDSLLDEVFDRLRVAGISPAEVQEIIGLVDEESLAAAAHQEGNWPTLFSAVIVRLAKALDIESALKKIQPSEAAKRKSIGGQTYYTISGGAVFSPGPTVFVVAKEPRLRSMIAASNVQTPLIQELKKINSDNDVIVVLNVPGNPEIYEKLELRMYYETPPIFRHLLRSIRGAESIALACDLSQPSRSTTLAELRIRGLDQFKAEILEATVNLLLVMGKPIADVIPIADFLLKQTSMSREGTEVRITTEVPEDWEKLATSATPILFKMRSIMRIDTRKNRLKQFGLALHNFQYIYESFPPPGSRADEHASLKGKLSWRVWLLPQFDFAEMYETMHLDEDWDSEHNRQFITKIPDAFSRVGSRNTGKTSYHIFVGNGAPFSNDKRTTLEDFKGRLHKTILVIEAGPDKAVEWTKPGGLEFDPKNPKAALGEVPDVFYAVMMDGSIRELTKDISNEELLELITGGKEPPGKAQE